MRGNRSFLNKFDVHGIERELKIKLSPNRWKDAKCPVHEGKRKSLGVILNSDGSLGLHCKKGCSFKDVFDHLKNLGLIETRKSSYNRYL